MRKRTFMGHKFIQLKTVNSKKLAKSTGWVLDVSDFNLYKVQTDKVGKPTGYEAVGKVLMNMGTGEISFIKDTCIPVSILKTAEKIAKSYYAIL